MAQRDPYEFPAIRAFAAELAAWRGIMPKTELAEILGYTPQLIGQIEVGKNLPSRRFAEDLDTYFKTNGLFLRLWKLISETRHIAALPPGFSKFVQLEREAGGIRIFALMLITGLLQRPIGGRVPRAHQVDPGEPMSTLDWRKSSRSGGGGGQCVEVASTWRKSSHSGGNCVEVVEVISR